MTKYAKVLFIEVWLFVLLVVIWWFASAGSTSIFFPSLQSILERVWSSWIVGGGAVEDLLPSVVNLLAGYAIAMVLGVALGTLIGLNRRLNTALDPLIEFLRAIPAVAIVPAAIIALGLGDDMRIFVIAFGAIWPVLVNTILGMQSTDTVVIDMASAFRLRGATRLFIVRLPSAAGQIFAGARTALAIAIVLIVVSEMFGATRGIGFAVLSAQRTYAITEMWAGIVVLGALSYLLNLILHLIENRALAWHPNRRASQRARRQTASIAAQQKRATP